MNDMEKKAREIVNHINSMGMNMINYFKIVTIADALQQTRREAFEECAKIAENIRCGYTANIRINKNEQELIKDQDGPWVLNSTVAQAIRKSMEGK